jgi:hypothetical protein
LIHAFAFFSPSLCRVFRTASTVRAACELLFDIYSAAAKSSANPPAAKTTVPPVTEAEIAHEEADIAKTERLARASLAIHQALSTIWHAAEAGDLEATKQLAEVAIMAATFLFRIELAHPKVARTAARGEVLWPVLARDKPTWAAETARRIADLDLGAGLEPLRMRFRKARGHDDNWPARQWAKGAVRTIEETRLRIMQFGEILRGFGSSEALVDWCMCTGWRGPQSQPWVNTVAQLPLLTTKSLPRYKAAIRDLIRLQIPDFHLHSAWSNQRHGAKLNGRDTKGAVQGRILEDICDALETLVPLPLELTSRNSGTEIPQRKPGSGKPVGEGGEARLPNARLNGGDDDENRNPSGNGK